jgi:hypothetical protein
VSGQDDAAALALARRLAATAAAGDVVGIERLAGGRNNRVFRIDIEGEPPLALKLYHADPRDPRDRLAREWEFLQYVWARGVRCVPQPLVRDAQAHAGLYRFLPGRKLAAAEIGAEQIDAVLAFVLAINGPPRDAQALATASDAAFSLAEHLALVQQRVDRLEALDAAALPDVARFVRTRLAPIWAEVRGGVEAGAQDLGLALDSPIGVESVCVSPSDIGFHNILAAETGLSFLDFEYAGRDDPAKLASDLFACPEVPAPIARRGAFVDGLTQGLGLDGRFVRRCDMLLDVYRVKWACIMLGDFLPVGHARRAFADDAATPEAQLARAEAKLDEIGAR